MGSTFTILTTFTFAVFIAILSIIIYIFNGGFWMPQNVPTLPSEWWGPGVVPAKEDTSIRPFKINIPDKTIEDLNNRLDNTRLPAPSLEGANFKYGFNAGTLHTILHYWRNDYKWKQREVYLNKFPQFMTKIQGLDIHFLHVKPTDKSIKTLPLLLLHGWPGSVREFYSLIEILNNPQNIKDYGIAFEIIAPSLPGYGWSSPAIKKGMGPAQIAVIFNNLMKRLGHESWYVQGGDWGAAIGTAMSTLYPQSVKGFHSNMCISMTPASTLKTILGSLWPSLIVNPKHESKMYPLGKIFAHIVEETGYMHIQATKPDTIGVGLNDSPAGLAAYIIEKFSTWTDPKNRYLADGGLTKKFTYEALLDNVMIYWVTNSIATSVRLYAENFSRANRELYIEYLPVKVPTACAKFAHEIFYQSDHLLKDKFVNLVQTHDFVGGHFAAMELPEIMANDIVEAIRKMEKFN